MQQSKIQSIRPSEVLQEFVRALSMWQSIVLLLVASGWQWAGVYGQVPTKDKCTAAEIAFIESPGTSQELYTAASLDLSWWIPSEEESLELKVYGLLHVCALPTVPFGLVF